MRGAALRLPALSSPGTREVFAHPTEGACSAPFPEEMAAARDMHLRAPHFLAGRAAAHAACAALGLPAGPILRGEAGEPTWPPGIVGSISHTAGLAVAVVAPREHALGVGIDIERLERRLDRRVMRVVCRPEEAAALANLEGTEGDDDDSAGAELVSLVSAKEVVYKVYFPLTRVRLGFHDASLERCPAGWRAKLCVPLPLPPGADGILEIESAHHEGFRIQLGMLRRPGVARQTR